MKRRSLGALLLATMMGFCLNGCSKEVVDDNAETQTQEITQELVTETEVVSIDGLYVDDSYVDEESSQLKRVYLFYTLSSDDANMEIDSKYTELTINDGNTYESGLYPGACDWMSSYYYSSFIEDVYMGDELKVAAIFEVPEADLAADRSITLSDNQIPTIEDIRLSTNDIIRCSSAEEIAQMIDPEGYENEQYLRAEADAETTERVRSAINNRYWVFYTNNFSYRTEFSAPNNFTTYTGGAAASGVYTVANGYVILTNDSNGFVTHVPYTWNGGEIELDLPAGYSIYE